MQGLEPSSAIDVQVLYTEGCPHTLGTLALVNQVATEMGIRLRLRTTLIETAEQAVEMRFLGSPTVLVNGLDMDPAARRSAHYGFV